MGQIDKNGVEVSVTELDSLAPSIMTRTTSQDRLTQRFNNDYAHVEHHIVTRVLIFVADILLALSPIAFLGIACTAMAYHGTSRDEEDGLYSSSAISRKSSIWDEPSGEGVIAAASVAVSIFPIFFAAIVGRFLKSYSMYCAERGASLGKLEQLYGSQNLFNAVQLSYALRGSGMVGIVIVFVWLLSPLGGQATSRVLYKDTDRNISAGHVYYTDTSASNGMWNDETKLAMYGETAHSLLSAALLSDSIMQGNDIYGNPRVPFLELLVPREASPAGTAKGFDGSQSALLSPKSSMVGLLVNNVTRKARVSFTSKTSYVSLTCEPMRVWSTKNGCPLSPEPPQFYRDFLDWAHLLNGLPNGSTTTAAANKTADQKTQRWIDWYFTIDMQADATSEVAKMGNDSKTPVFIYALKDRENCSITAYRCPSRLTWVESEIRCEVNDVCQILKMRNSTSPLGANSGGIFNVTYIDGDRKVGLPAMLENLNTFSNDNIARVNPIEWYLGGSDYSFKSEVEVNGKPNPEVWQPDYSKLSESLVAQRLSTLINTYWMIGLQGGATAHARSENATLIMDSLSNSTTVKNTTGLGYDVIQANAEFVIFTYVYRASWVFVVITIVISVIMLVLGFVGIYLRHLITHPDILGSVSTLTRENPNFETPIDAHKASGVELAAYYKKMEVEIVKTGIGDDGGWLTLRPVRRY